MSNEVIWIGHIDPADYAEDQTSELEILRSIYTEEEFTVISVSPPCFEILVQSADDTVSSKYIKRECTR